MIDLQKSYRTSALPIVDAEKLLGVDIFNIDEGYGRSFCISERVKDELKSAKVTGCSYESISDR